MGKRTNTAVWMEKYNRWQINVQKDGKRRSFFSSTPGRTGQRECNAKADAWVDSDIKTSNARIGPVFNEYLESLKLTTSRSNWMQIESIRNVWIEPFMGNKKIEKITEQNFQDVLNQAYSQGRSKKTISNIRATMVGFIKYCRKRHLTTLSLDDLSIPKGARIIGKGIMQPEDIMKLFSIDTTVQFGKRVFEPYIYAYRLQVLTGLRPGELIGLRWSDIQDNVIFIQRAINYRGELTKGKNENAIRKIVLGSRALEQVSLQRRLSESTDSMFAITTQNHYEERLKRYCSSNEISPITPYELRHTFVSVAKVLPEGQVRALVGHSRNMDTFGIYGHNVEGEREQTACAIDVLFDEIMAQNNNDK